MPKEVTNEEILSAVTEFIISHSNLEKKVDLINSKFTIITENQLTQQADIRELQSVNNLI